MVFGRRVVFGRGVLLGSRPGRILLTVAIAAGVTLLPSHEAAASSCPTGSGITVTCGVVYNPADAETLDVYKPVGASLDPIVLVIHGGGWAKGASSSESGLATYLAQNGFVAMAVNYTLVSGTAGVFPAGLDDVETSASWAVANATSWGGDPTKVVALGESAGANLADELANLVNPSSAKPWVKAAVGWSAPSDLTALVNMCGTTCQPGSPGKTVELYLGCSPSTCPTAYQQASPTANVSKLSAPQLILNSTDEAIPVGQAAELASLLQAQCITHEYTVLPGDQHAATYVDLLESASGGFLKAALAGTLHGACPGQPSPPETGAAGAWDAALGKAILFGGCCNTAGKPINTTWELNGNIWQKVTTKSAPSGRMDASIAYDPAMGKVVLFGGQGAASTTGESGKELGDTWTFDGTTWTEVSKTGPSARDSTAMAWDGASGDLVLFGGQNYPSGALAASALHDTWTWNGTVWTSASGGSTTPAARYGASIAADPGSGHVVLFGGNTTTSTCSSSCFDLENDTWTWNGSAWSLRSSGSPSAREYAAIALDQATNTVVLFGGLYGTTDSQGNNTDTLLGDTWTWNGSAWSQQATSPPARFGATLTYDSGSGGRVVLTGGFQGATTLSGILYAWNGTWSKL